MIQTIGISDMKISNRVEDILVTHSLGSCIGLSLYDPVANIGGGFSFASPTTIVSAPVNAPSAVLNDNDLSLKLHNDYASVVGSALTGIVQ